MYLADFNRVILSAGACAAVVLLYYAYYLLFDPLSKVPSPHWSCPFSSAWILVNRYHQRELRIVYTAHKQLGPIVRVGPREISVSHYETGVHDVYDAGFDKPHYYSFYRYYG